MTEVFQLDDIHKHMFREKPKPTASGWSFSLVRDGNGKAIPILANALIIMREVGEISDAFSFDEMLRACILEGRCLHRRSNSRRKLCHCHRHGRSVTLMCRNFKNGYSANKACAGSARRRFFKRSSSPHTSARLSATRLF